MQTSVHRDYPSCGQIVFQVTEEIIGVHYPQRGQCKDICHTL